MKQRPVVQAPYARFEFVGIDSPKAQATSAWNTVHSVFRPLYIAANEGRLITLSPRKEKGPSQGL